MTAYFVIFENSLLKNHFYIKPKMADTSKILLVFDLDETLIYATTETLRIREDFTIGNYFVYKRPYLDELLKETSAIFDLGIWSSATEMYVNEMIRNIQQEGTSFKFTWSREHCTMHYDKDWNDYVYLKKLSKLENFGYSLNRILMVEDTPRNLQQNYGNAIIVSHFKGTPDSELLQLKNYLTGYKDVENVRAIEKRNWRQNLK